MNKIHLILSVVIGIGTLVGGAFIIDGRFTKQAVFAESCVQISQDMVKADVALAAEISGVSKRFELLYKQDRVRALQEQMWALERYYGIDKAKDSGEYKRLKMERERLLRELEWVK